MKFLDTLLFTLGLCTPSATAVSYSSYESYLFPRLDNSLSLENAYAAGLRDAALYKPVRTRDTFEDTTDLSIRSDLDFDTYSLYARSAEAEAEAEAWKDLATSLATQLILERRGGTPRPKSASGGSRPGSPAPGTAAYERMIGIKHDMTPGHRYVFRAVQAPKTTSDFGPDMAAYCSRKGYNHQFLIVGEVTADKDFTGKWWDLRKEQDKSTSSASERFDGSKGRSLTVTYLGTTTKSDASISAYGSAVNKANGKVWLGDNYDCKSYVDQLAGKIVGQ